MPRSLLVTGGAGFIGANAASHFARKGWKTTVLDNLSRPGAEANLAWLRDNAPIDFCQIDVRDTEAVMQRFAETRFDAVLHLAGQVAVTHSLTDPRNDFEANALGTFNLLEAVRRLQPQAAFIYASTNKVYGRMEGVPIIERNGRYDYADLEGADEDQPLEFHSPYGCSKGAADQYVVDYARIYGLRTTSFRQSCIYGPRQFGVEDQGWVAWFAIAAILGRKITIYGDGKQVRDVLHVDDLVHAYELALEQPDRVAGKAFNIGGGRGNVLSLLDLVARLEGLLGRSIELGFDRWRPGDQEVFISKIDKINRCVGWSPRIGVEEGIGALVGWIAAHRGLFDAADRAPEPAHAARAAGATA